MKILARSFRLLNIIFLVIILPLFWMYFFQGNPPVVYTHVPFTIINKTLKPGDPIEFEFTACRKKQYPMTMYANIVDGFIITLDSKDNIGNPVGCFTKISGTFIVPKFLESGTYKLKGTNIFHINLLRDRAVNWETESFTVTK